jgi:hypothetical protein
MTTSQALAAGMTDRQLRTLVSSGWGHPHRGVFISPQAADPFRASVAAALIVKPQAVACRQTAARLHRLWGLPEWSKQERPRLMLPLGVTHNPRAGMNLHSSLLPHERTVQDGFPSTTLARTVQDLALVLGPAELVCAVDSALRLGWIPKTSRSRGRQRLARAIALSDARSESPLETLIRLLLVEAGIGPEELQHPFWLGGPGHARLDMAWPSVRLAVEADGRKYHDDPEPLYRDRDKGNGATTSRWRVLRFTWADVKQRPQWIVQTVRTALALG